MGEKIDTLGDALPREIARVRDEVLPEYLAIGPAGIFAATMMRQSLDLASKAMIEGDSLRLGAVEIRLHGIDAPEMDQVCHRSGKPWRCGVVAAAELRKLIDGRAVDCTPVVQSDGSTTDRYGRVLGRCSVAGVELNAWMVEQGLAVAFVRYSAQFVPQEDRARQARRGMWAGEFQAPWDFRREKAAKRGR